MSQSLVLIIDDIRSAENVGSIFRTADAAGVNKIYLCGITPRPPRKDIDKSALGAVDFVEWEYREDIQKLIENLRKDRFSIIALEQDKRSISYQLGLPNKISKTDIALVVGNETEGISRKVLDNCDQILEIPMHGKKNSLNVSVATGIALFELIK